MANIAILISTYNRKAFLEKTLDSLTDSLNGSIHTPHIFVFDDGSDDGSVELLDSRKGRPYMDAFMHGSKNRGLRYVLDTGIYWLSKYEKGFDYICYCDDLQFENGWLDEFVNLWEDMSEREHIGFITGHDAPEHPTEKKTLGIKLKRTCRATQLFASRDRWALFGDIPDLTPGIATPKPGYGSLVDWWLVGHPEGKYPESLNSLKNRGEYVAVLERVKHTAFKGEDSTWGNQNMEYMI